MGPIYKKVALGVLIIATVATITYLEETKPNQGPVTTVLQTLTQNTSGTATGPAATGTPAAFLASRASTVAQEAKQYPSAPEITNPSGWINTQPLTLSGYVGKDVVLVDFWTYSCINCIRTIPYVEAWYQKYKDQGLVIVGVHSPEFQFEHDLSNVQNAVKSLGITYPVVLDNDMSTWDAYQNLYWPADYLINVDGFITYTSFGEGDYAQTEAAIQQALAQRDQALGLPDTVPTGTVDPTNAVSVNSAYVDSPETYFGAERNPGNGAQANLANGTPGTTGVQALSTPSLANIQMNSLYLGGTWDFESQYATNQNAGATITYEYSSKNVYIVASGGSGNTPVTLKILRDGKPLGAAAGSDVSSSSTMTVEAQRLYSIVADPSDYGEHTLQITVENPGLEAYTFTFG